MSEELSMWDDDSATTLQDLEIFVPWFVRFDLDDDGNEIRRDVSPCDIASIVQGNCDSGAWMPACTYYTAKRNLCENSVEVYDYLNNYVPAGRIQDSWGQTACDIVSLAVEKWARRVASKLHVEHGYEAVKPLN